MTTYTKITKASGTAYTKVSGGHHLYDDTVDTYDTSFVTYDGLNHQSAWTRLGGGYSIAAEGQYEGFGAFTYSGGQRLIAMNAWVKIPKAT